MGTGESEEKKSERNTGSNAMDENVDLGNIKRKLNSEDSNEVSTATGDLKDDSHTVKRSKA